MENGSTAQNGRGWMEQRGWERKTGEKLKEIVSKKKKNKERIGDYPQRTLFVKKQVFYVPGFIFYPGIKKISLNHPIVIAKRGRGEKD